jgi:hypothetical protein
MGMIKIVEEKSLNDDSMDEGMFSNNVNADYDTKDDYQDDSSIDIE